MRAPAGGGDLVFNQLIDCVRIRHAQQRLGQTHQGHPFIGGKAVLGQKDFHQAGFVVGADVPDELHGGVADARARSLGNPRPLDQA